MWDNVKVHFKGNCEILECVLYVIFENTILNLTYRLGI